MNSKRKPSNPIPEMGSQKSSSSANSNFKSTKNSTTLLKSYIQVNVAPCRVISIWLRATWAARPRDKASINVIMSPSFKIIPRKIRAPIVSRINLCWHRVPMIQRRHKRIISLDQLQLILLNPFRTKESVQQKTVIRAKTPKIEKANTIKFPPQSAFQKIVPKLELKYCRHRMSSLNIVFRMIAFLQIRDFKTHSFERKGAMLLYWLTKTTKTLISMLTFIKIEQC